MLRIFFLELYIIMEQERKIKKVYPFLKKNGDAHRNDLISHF